MEDPMPKPPQAYGKLQDIKGLASPQSSPVRCSPGGAGLRSAAACGLALDIFPLQEHFGASKAARIKGRRAGWLAFVERA